MQSKFCGAGRAGCKQLRARPLPFGAGAFSSNARRSGANKCRAAESAATVAITAEGLIFPRGEPGAWDAAAVGHPIVRCYVGDNEQRWFMWYTGQGEKQRTSEAAARDALTPASGSVGVAVSGDGVNWTRGAGSVVGTKGSIADAGACVEPNAGDWWAFDTNHMSASDVQIMSSGNVGGGTGVYWMFYSGGDFSQVAAPDGVPHLDAASGAIEGLATRPGLAMSQDARNWARIEGDHHSGALFDVGKPGEWDELMVAAPQVLAAGPRDMRMYYHSYDVRAQRFRVGLATSADGFNWTRQGVVFEGDSQNGAHDALGAASRHVLRDPDTKKYLMFYEAVAADGKRSIGLAVSDDGLVNWRRAPQPLLEASAVPGAWDAGGVGCPCAVPMSAGRYRLYYAGKSAAGAGPWDGIGLALSVEAGQAFEGAPALYKRRTGRPAAAQA